MVRRSVNEIIPKRLAYDTGCGASELGDLKIDNLDVARQSLLVESGKEQKDRMVYFGDKCCDKITDWAENLAILRHIAISLFKQAYTTKVGIRNKRLKAG